MQMIITNGRVVLPDQIISSGEVLAEDGRIVAAAAKVAEFDRAGAAVIDAEGGYIAPGFMDIHVHGSGGYDVMSADAAEFERLAEYLAASGTTAWLATTMTAPADQLMKVVAASRRANVDGGAELLGLHLEGPYINPGKAGAQAPDFVRPFDVAELARLQEASGERIRRVTLAPEILPNLTVLEKVGAMGILVSVGHSLADYETTKLAAASGCRLATHLFNGMGILDHHNPGVVGAALDLAEMMVEFIPDGIHLHPAIVRMIVSLKGADKAVLITDARSPSGLAAGDYPEMGVRVAEDAIYTLEGVLAGSTLTMAEGVKNAITKFGLGPAEAFRMATLTPAEIMGVADRKGSLEPGKDADIVVLSASFVPKFTLVRGKLVYRGM